MIVEFTTKNMSDLLYSDLSAIKDDNENKTKVILQTPTKESVFPCRVINTPLDSILKSERGIPILKNFEITIEHWCNSQEQCMEMASNTDKELQKRNILRTNTQSIIYDETTQMYRFITSYKVRWECLTNSFKFKNE